MGINFVTPQSWGATESEAWSRPFRFEEVIERCAGAILLVASSPLILGSAAALTIAYRSFPLVAHRRVGQGHSSFWMLKLRTMGSSKSTRFRIERIDIQPETDNKDRRDPRITSRFAAFCRRHSIDELPQLWHVATGSMSLVGPRPLTAIEIERHYGNHAAELVSVRPGLTGLWQVSGRSELGMQERVALDLKLVQRLSARVYWDILLRTISAVINGKGAW